MVRVFRGLFLPARQNRLKMRRLFFGGDDADFDFFQACRFKPAVQIAFGKTKPAVAVKFARLLKLVREQIKNQNLSARLEQFCRARQSRRRIFGVMQSLT